MARPKGGVESIQGWFRQYFRDNTKSLRTRSNKTVIAAWMEAHPGQEFSKREKNAMSNAKGEEKKRQKVRNKRKSEESGESPAPVAVVENSKVSVSRGAPGGLEVLEESIDACLTHARELRVDNDQLEDVVRALRHARNSIVWLQGE